MRIKKSSSLLPQIQRGNRVSIIVDGKSVEAFEGETIAAALVSSGIKVFKHSRKHNEPRGLYCGIGICFECLVTVNGVHAQRACITPVVEGMQIETSKELKI